MFDIQASDTLRLADLSQKLSVDTQLMVQVIAKTDSTNSLLLTQSHRLPLHPKPAIAYLALQQTNGRGRLGRKWISDNKNTGIDNVGIHKNTALCFLFIFIFFIL